MNTWIFSKNGEITKPLELAAAKKYVVENQDAYGWKSSFTQWLPVKSINEFSALLPESKPLPQLPQKIVDEFLSKEKALEKHFENFIKEFSTGDTNAKEFEQEIENYKKLTVNLSDEVKGNINEIEEQFNILNEKLKGIKQTVETSQQELNTVVTDFNKKISEKSVIKASPEDKPSVAADSQKDKSTPEVVKVEKSDKKSDEVQSKTSETKAEPEVTKEAETAVKADVVSDDKSEKKDTASVEEEVTARPQRPTGAKVISTRSSNPHLNFSRAESAKPEASSSEEKSKAEIIDLATSKQNKIDRDEEDNDPDNLQSKLESGVKNIFKSVFTKEETADANNKFSTLVQKNEETQNDAETVKAEVEDEEPKVLRRRRRK